MSVALWVKQLLGQAARQADLLHGVAWPLGNKLEACPGANRYETSKPIGPRSHSHHREYWAQPAPTPLVSVDLKRQKSKGKDEILQGNCVSGALGPVTVTVGGRLRRRGGRLTAGAAMYIFVQFLY